MKALVLLVVLAACTAPPGRPVTSGLRDSAAPVASQLDATEARLAGDWVVVQGAGVDPGARIRIAPGRMRIDGAQIGDTALVALGQGRFRTDAGPLWVHWLDVANRTAALGDPGGSRVWIMDRTASGSPDRTAAAREILGWYGYDLTRLAAR